MSFIRRYPKYCSKKLESELNDLDTPLSSDNMTNLYNPQNAYDFIVNNEHYNKSSIKKNLITLLRYLKLASNNPFLTYNLPIGIGEPTIKLIITKEELIKFVNFLNTKHLYVIIIICMLMYKFWLRIGALAKIKVNDFLPDNVILFKEKKNNKLIKRKLLKEAVEIFKTFNKRM